jgi:hypothetical protein
MLNAERVLRHSAFSIQNSELKIPMLTPSPPKRPRRSERSPKSAPPNPPPAPLVFVSGIVDPGAYGVYLSFDRDIDIAGVDVTQFTLGLAADGVMLVGAGTATLNGFDSIHVPMVVAGGYGGSVDLVSATAANGIVAAGDGGAWAGCSNVQLPYPTPPAALVLQAAAFDSGAGTCTLTFDRAIDVSAMAVDQVSVGDASSGTLYVGTGSPLLVGPNSVQVTLTSAGSYGGGSTVLNASGSTNILAVDDGGTWGGASDVGLPYP